jgi:hypothetical protein
MFKLMMMAGLLTGVADAAPYDVEGPTERVSKRGPFSGTPIEEGIEKMEEKKTKEQLEAEERLRKLNEARAKQGVRVVVLQEKITDVGYENETLRRNVRARIGNTAAKFYPDVDLYQYGRKEPDETLRPLDQRARVPDEVIGQLEEAWQSVASVPWNALDETEWGEQAARLKALADSVWFVDRPELREPLFKLYAQIGRAAENSNNPIPPFFEQVARVDVNYYFYAAAAMAVRTPELMSTLTDQELYQNVDYLRQRLDAGEFAPMTLNFELGGEYNPDKFVSEYKTYFNGVEETITNEQALFDVPPGRMDVFLERPGDGYGMSVRVESIRVDRQDLESVRDQARKRMGIDFIEQLLKNPEQCIPEVEGDILNYLAIYQKLHEGQEIYVAVPEAGSTQKILLWKWVADQGTLLRVNDNTGGFPVRFVGLIGTGLAFNGANMQEPENIDFLVTPPSGNANLDPTQLLAEAVKLSASSASLPSYELRGHYNHLMVGLGLEYNVSVAADRGFREIPRTQTREHSPNPDGTTQPTRDRILTTVGDRVITDANGQVTSSSEVLVPYVRELMFQRGVFLNVAGVIGDDAAAGFGPRIGIRTGWYNAPRALDLTAHGGWSVLMTRSKKKEKPDSRVHAIVDANVFAGAMLPHSDTLLLLNAIGDPNPGSDAVVGYGRTLRGTPNSPCTVDATNTSCERRIKRFGRPIPNFGFSAKAGLTF